MHADILRVALDWLELLDQAGQTQAVSGLHPVRFALRLPRTRSSINSIAGWWAWLSACSAAVELFGDGEIIGVFVL